LIIGSQDSGNNTIKIWNIDTGSLLKTINTGLFTFSSLELLNNGELLGGIQITNKFYYTNIQVWNVSLSVSRNFDSLWGKIYGSELLDNILAVCFDNDYDEPYVGLYSITAKKYLNVWQISPKLFFWNYTKTIIKLSKKGKLITSTYLNTIYVWDVKNISILISLKSHTDSITSLVLIEYADINKNDILISGSKDQSIKIWNINTGEILQTLIGHSNSVTSLALASNNSYLISGSEDYTINLWELKYNNNIKIMAQLTKSLRGHSAPITILKISFKNELISASDDSIIKIWSIKTGECLRNLTNIKKIGSLLITNENKLLL
jgi:WD40 repeat protein